MKTIFTTIYIIVPVIGIIIALLSAFPVPPRSPGRATIEAQHWQRERMTAYAHTVEQQRSPSSPSGAATRWTAQDEAAWCAKQPYGCGHSGPSSSSSLAAAVDDLRQRLDALESAP